MPARLPNPETEELLVEPSDDRRAEPRVELLGEAGGEVTVVQPLRLVELSARGAQVEIGHPLAVDSLHDFRLHLGPQMVVVKARIAHCHLHEIDQDRVVYRAGVEFVAPGAHALEAIARHLDAIRAARAMSPGEPS